MRKRHCLTFLSLFLFAAGRIASGQIVVQGLVTDMGLNPTPVQGAWVEVTDMSDTLRTFFDDTDEYGRYSIIVWAAGVEEAGSRRPDEFLLAQNYPNPFNPSTVVGYAIPRPSDMRIAVYTILGTKVKTLWDGMQESLSGELVWDGTDESGRGVSAGIYICMLESEGVRRYRKMAMTDGHAGYAGTAAAVAARSAGSGNGALKKQCSDTYSVSISGENIETAVQENVVITDDLRFDVDVFRTFTDIDGNVYRIVRIGNQWWLAENLKSVHFRNGDPVPLVAGGAEWANLQTPAYCNYDNNAGNNAGYGRLYNWYAVSDARGLAPAGWHVPVDEEWQAMVEYLGGKEVAGGKMKEEGTSHWMSPNTGATNESAFSALPGGYRNILDGNFFSMGEHAQFWTATELDNSVAWRRYLRNDIRDLYHSPNYKQYGFSVRCVKDAGPEPDGPFISGFVRTEGGEDLAGVILTFDNGGGSDTTSSSGYYRNPVPKGWSGTVTLSLQGYAFSPYQRSYSDIQASMPGQDYTGKR